MKVVLNRCHGGFGLSPLAMLKAFEAGSPIIEVHTVETYYGSPEAAAKAARDYAELEESLDLPDYPDVRHRFPSALELPDGRLLTVACSVWDEKLRQCPKLAQVIEMLGSLANTDYSRLRVVEIPDGIEFDIYEVDGMESIHERHRIWTGDPA